MGKGSRRRACQISDAELERRWKEVFARVPRKVKVKSIHPDNQVTVDLGVYGEALRDVNDPMSLVRYEK